MHGKSGGWGNRLEMLGDLFWLHIFDINAGSQCEKYNRGVWETNGYVLVLYAEIHEQYFEDS